VYSSVTNNRELKNIASKPYFLYFITNFFQQYSKVILWEYFLSQITISCEHHVPVCWLYYHFTCCGPWYGPSNLGLQT